MATMIEFSRRGAILAEIRRSSHLVSVGIAYSPVVQAVQSALIASGYDVGPTGADGKLGPKTTAAIKKYQADHGLTPTGSVDDATKDVLGAATAAVVSTPAGKVVSKEIAASVVKDAASDMTLPLILGGLVVVLAGVAVWALTKKGV